jgi:hypothetical protein
MISIYDFILGYRFRGVNVLFECGFPIPLYKGKPLLHLMEGSWRVCGRIQIYQLFRTWRSGGGGVVS